MFENENRYFTAMYMKENGSDKYNYRPVIILLNLSNFFESCLCKQISTVFKDILSRGLLSKGLGKNIVFNTIY